MVTAGTLALGATGSISNSPTITLAAGATLDASAQPSATLSLVGQKLAGAGAVTGSLVADANSAVAPGTASAIGALTISANTTLGGTSLMKLNKSVSPSNDVLNVAGTLTYGGTLQVSNIGGALAAGDTFQLFSATTYAGSFGATNLPAGYSWNWNPASGTLTVVSGSVNPNPTNLVALLAGNSLTLSWPADHTGWTLQCQTNSLGSGLNPGAWFDVAGSSSTDSVTITIDPAKPTVFYRLRL